MSNLYRPIQSETLTVYKGVENRVYSPVQDGREPLYSNNGVSPMLSGRIDPFSTPLYNGRNKLFPPSSCSCSPKVLTMIVSFSDQRPAVVTIAA